MVPFEQSHLLAYFVSFHPVKIRSSIRHCVEEVSPQQLLQKMSCCQRRLLICGVNSDETDCFPSCPTYAVTNHLSCQRNRWFCVISDAPIHILNAVVKVSGRQAAKLHHYNMTVHLNTSIQVSGEGQLTVLG